jgi:hypothetical protein
MWRTKPELERSGPHNLAKKESGLASGPREAFAEAVIRSVELIVQAAAHDVAGEMCVAPFMELIVHAQADNIKLIL